MRNGVIGYGVPARNQAIRYGKARLARVGDRKMYTFSHYGYRPAMRVGIRKIGA